MMRSRTPSQPNKSQPNELCPVRVSALSVLKVFVVKETEVCRSQSRRCITLLLTKGPMKIATRLLFLLAVTLPSLADSKPKLTLDDFFNSVGYTSVQLSPDGNNVVIGTDRADWDQQIFRKDLWLYRDANGGTLVQLTESGHDKNPQWSP